MWGGNSFPSPGKQCCLSVYLGLLGALQSLEEQSCEGTECFAMVVARLPRSWPVLGSAMGHAASPRSSGSLPRSTCPSLLALGMCHLLPPHTASPCVAPFCLQMADAHCLSPSTCGAPGDRMALSETSSPRHAPTCVPGISQQQVL